MLQAILSERAEGQMAPFDWACSVSWTGEREDDASLGTWIAAGKLKTIETMSEAFHQPTDQRVALQLTPSGPASKGSKEGAMPTSL